MTSPKKKPRGKPREWSQKLWDAYAYYGKSDAGYVAACNRFLDQMLEHRLDETQALVRSLMHLAVLKGEVPFPERYKSGIPSVDLAMAAEGDAHDYLDVYRHWYSENIKWPEECLCEPEEVEVGRMRGLLSPGAGQLERRWRTHPWFLTACVQLTRRSLSGEFGSLVDRVELDYDDEGNRLIKAGDELRVYLTRGVWRIDDAPMEDLKDVYGIGFSLERKPEEDRRTYINRVKDRLDDRLIWAMEKSTEIALHPKVNLLRGRPLNIRFRHEDMLVLRLFGLGKPTRPIERYEIVDAMPDAFLKEDGEPVQYPLDAVSERADLIGRYLGFLAAGGETP